MCRGFFLGLSAQPIYFKTAISDERNLYTYIYDTRTFAFERRARILGSHLVTNAGLDVSAVVSHALTPGLSLSLQLPAVVRRITTQARYDWEITGLRTDSSSGSTVRYAIAAAQNQAVPDEYREFYYFFEPSLALSHRENRVLFPGQAWKPFSAQRYEVRLIPDFNGRQAALYYASFKEVRGIWRSAGLEILTEAALHVDPRLEEKGEANARFFGKFRPVVRMSDWLLVDLGWGRLDVDRYASATEIAFEPKPIARYEHPGWGLSLTGGNLLKSPLDGINLTFYKMWDPGLPGL